MCNAIVRELKPNPRIVQTGYMLLVQSLDRPDDWFERVGWPPYREGVWNHAGPRRGVTAEPRYNPVWYDGGFEAFANRRQAEHLARLCWRQDRWKNPVVKKVHLRNVRLKTHDGFFTSDTWPAFVAEEMKIIPLRRKARRENK